MKPSGSGRANEVKQRFNCPLPIHLPEYEGKHGACMRIHTGPHILIHLVPKRIHSHAYIRSYLDAGVLSNVISLKTSSCLFFVHLPKIASHAQIKTATHAMKAF